MKKTKNMIHLKMLALFTFAVWLSVSAAAPAGATNQFDIAGPPGSENFGHSVTVLPNGDIVVTDPLFDAGGLVDAGAIYLFDGISGALINSTSGPSAGDKVGSGGVTVLANGNYVVYSPNWHNGAFFDAGAVTWGSKDNGIQGQISAANSLVGSITGDLVGSGKIFPLNNGNYLVGSPDWDNGAALNAGAVTWGNGATGIAGPVSAANSLVGSSTQDRIGDRTITRLSNGNYVTWNESWDNGALADVGAVTWGNGNSGVSGVISAANSIIGSHAGDEVGYSVYHLTNGNYVILNPNWDNGSVVDVGAVTWRKGTIPTSGYITSGNSLVGLHTSDRVGSNALLPLTNGNYVFGSPEWDHGTISNAGAVTWGNGASGTTGIVSATNSLVGSSDEDKMGYRRWITVLNNGNYVICNPLWDHWPIEDAGAATWGNGNGGTVGEITIANSLIGENPFDQVCSGDVYALTNGNYVVSSPEWDNGAIEDAGAATWGNGASGIKGVITPENSLVSLHAHDYISSGVLLSLTNGNYVVASRSWDNGSLSSAGAVTWGNGNGGTTGPVTAENSLVGGSQNDGIGSWKLLALTNGNYVVTSHDWHNGVIDNAGAVTWGNGSGGTTGVVSAENSLVGSTTDDRVGFIVHDSFGPIALANGNYVVPSPEWAYDNQPHTGAATWGDGVSGVSGTISATNSLIGNSRYNEVGYTVHSLSSGDYVVFSPNWMNSNLAYVGAITWGDGSSGTNGPVTPENSVIGTTQGGGSSMVFAYDPVNHQLVVGRPYDNIVTIFYPGGEKTRLFLPLVGK